FSMSDLGGYAYANGQKVPLRTQGNNILVPTEEGLVAVPIEEFDVVMVDGQVMLVAEVNWRFLIRWWREIERGMDRTPPGPDVPLPPVYCPFTPPEAMMT
ncbi:hypothetical protein M1N80_04400, partial [Peptococcaceae bacterium]|nr:hypothetical protein [Peptococcaceae bacterium]